MNKPRMKKDKVRFILPSSTHRTWIDFIDVPKMNIELIQLITAHPRHI